MENRYDLRRTACRRAAVVEEERGMRPVKRPRMKKDKKMIEKIVEKPKFDTFGGSGSDSPVGPLDEKLVHEKGVDAGSPAMAPYRVPFRNFFPNVTMSGKKKNFEENLKKRNFSMTAGSFNPNPANGDGEFVAETNPTNVNLSETPGTPVLTPGVSILANREREKL